MVAIGAVQGTEQVSGRLNGSMLVKEMRQDTYGVMVSVRAGSAGRPKTIVGIQNVEVVLRAVGVPEEARAKAISELRARRVGSTGRVPLFEAGLKRLGLI